MTAPGLPNYANYEFVFSAPDGRMGVLPGVELHRMILAALNSSRAELIESIAAGFDTAAKDAAVHNKGPDRDIDVVLAWECAARWIREHAGNRFPSPQGATAGPTGTPGNPCPSRIAHESGAGLGCLRAPGHQGSHRAGSPPTRWWDDDDRVLPPVDVSYGPTSAPGVSPECQQSAAEVHEACDGCLCDCHNGEQRHAGTPGAPDSCALPTALLRSVAGATGVSADALIERVASVHAPADSPQYVEADDEYVATCTCGEQRRAWAADAATEALVVAHIRPATSPTGDPTT